MRLLSGLSTDKETTSDTVKDPSSDEKRETHTDSNENEGLIGESGSNLQLGGSLSVLSCLDASETEENEHGGSYEFAQAGNHVLLEASPCRS